MNFVSFSDNAMSDLCIKHGRRINAQTNQGSGILTKVVENFYEIGALEDVFESMAEGVDTLKIDDENFVVDCNLN